MIWPDTSNNSSFKKRDLEFHISIIEQVMTIKWNKMDDLVLIIQIIRPKSSSKKGTPYLHWKKRHSVWPSSNQKKNRWSFLHIPGKWYKINPPMINYVSAMSSIWCLFGFFILMWVFQKMCCLTTSIYTIWRQVQSNCVWNEHDPQQVLINTCMICCWISTSLTPETASKVQKKKEFLFFWRFLKKNIFPY